MAVGALLSALSAAAATADDALAPGAIAERWNQQKIAGQKTRGLVVSPGATLPEGAAVVGPDGYVELPAGQEVEVAVRFDFDSAVLKPTEIPKLGPVCEAMKTVDIPLFQVIGHTDAVGGDAYNQRLSLLRAEEVVRYLVDDCGIDPDRLKAVGVGERHLADTADPTSEANRRVEFQVAS